MSRQVNAPTVLGRDGAKLGPVGETGMVVAVIWFRFGCVTSWQKEYADGNL